MGKIRQLNMGIEVTPSAGYGAPVPVSSRHGAIGAIELQNRASSSHHTEFLLTGLSLLQDELIPFSNTLEPVNKSKADTCSPQDYRREIESAIDSRNDSLQALRELGPPDLVHLVKQSVKSGGRQVSANSSTSLNGAQCNSAHRPASIITLPA